MICGHTAKDINPLQAITLLSAKTVSGTTQSLMLRSVHSNQAEMEAEMLTSLIQERVFKLQRPPEPISSDREIEIFIQAFELD